MTVTTAVLLAGWIVFVALGLVWFFIKTMPKALSNKPIPPARTARQLAVFVGANLVWLSLMGLSAGGELAGLMCFWAIMVPALAFVVRMTYLGNKKRNLLLEQESSHTDKEGESTPLENPNDGG